MSWQPIEDLNVEGREMFVVRAFNVCNGFTGGKPYTSDPWCVWRESDGSFARWPHHFPPTHFCVLPSPEAPDVDRDSDGELLIDWSPKKGRMLSMTLRDDGRLSYAFTWDGEEAHGTAQMPPPTPT